MQKYINKQPVNAHSYYYMLVGHDHISFLHPELFVPRGTVVRDGIPQWSDNHKFIKTYDIQPWDLHTKTVSNWTSRNQYYGSLTPQTKFPVDCLKKFLNLGSTENLWDSLLVFHDTECRIGKKYNNGNHFHIVIKTTIQQPSKHGYYRSLQTAMSKAGGTCTLERVTRDVEGFLHYLTGEEKTYLGANSDELRSMMAEAEQYTGQINQWLLEPTEEDEPKRQPQFQFEILPAGAHLEQTIAIPEHLSSKSYGAESVNFLLSLLKKHSDCRDLNTLISKYDVINDETGRALCQIAISQQGERAMKLALNQLTQESNNKPISEIIQELPDEISGYMTPRESQAMFNSWCQYQGINARKFAMTMQLVLSGKSHKRIGIYLQGQPNSGKTAITNSSWKCLGDISGRITKEQFCFQDCAGKRIIIGEEIAITQTNIDRFKDLLSGATLKCEIKMKAPADCNPAIVLLNSNVTYRLNLDTEKAGAIRIRIFNFEGLKPCNMLTQMKGNFHPKMYYHNVIPLSQDEEQALKCNDALFWAEQQPIGDEEIFTGDWNELQTTAMEQEADEIIPATQIENISEPESPESPAENQVVPDTPTKPTPAKEKEHPLKSWESAETVVIGDTEENRPIHVDVYDMTVLPMATPKKQKKTKKQDKENTETVNASQTPKRAKLTTLDTDTPVWQQLSQKDRDWIKDNLLWVQDSTDDSELTDVIRDVSKQAKSKYIRHYKITTGRDRPMPDIIKSMANHAKEEIRQEAYAYKNKVSSIDFTIVSNGFTGRLSMIKTLNHFYIQYAHFIFSELKHENAGYLPYETDITTGCGDVARPRDDCYDQPEDQYKWNIPETTQFKYVGKNQGRIDRYDATDDGGYLTDRRITDEDTKNKHYTTVTLKDTMGIIWGRVRIMAEHISKYEYIKAITFTSNTVDDLCSNRPICVPIKQQPDESVDFQTFRILTYTQFVLTAYYTGQQRHDEWHNKTNQVFNIITMVLGQFFCKLEHTLRWEANQFKRIRKIILLGGKYPGQRRDKQWDDDDIMLVQQPGTFTRWVSNYETGEPMDETAAASAVTDGAV